MNDELEKIATTVSERLNRHGVKGRTVTLKIKYHDFKISTRSHSYADPVGDFDTIFETAKQLLLATEPDDVKIRLLGISLSNFPTTTRTESTQDNDQLRLF